MPRALQMREKLDRDEVADGERVSRRIKSRITRSHPRVQMRRKLRRSRLMQEPAPRELVEE